jgi:hypothetical protein
MQITEVSVIGVRSAVIELRRPGSELRFVLFPMVHFGQPSFYTQVVARLRECDLIVSEGYDTPSSTGRAYAIAMRATGQQIGGGLVSQDIDHAALGVPTLWPETSSRRSRRYARMPVWEWLWVCLLVPFLVGTMAVGGRRWLLRRRMEINDSDRPLFSRIGPIQRLMIDERDADLLKVLAELHEERRDEAIRIAVVYGAAHMPAVVQGMCDRFGYRARKADWLTVIPF